MGPQAGFQQRPQAFHAGGLVACGHHCGSHGCAKAHDTRNIFGPAATVLFLTAALDQSLGKHHAVPHHQRSDPLRTAHLVGR